MFGYVRPYKPELKIKEFEQFKACYCALCHTLGEQYGQFSRTFLSYDFVFLTMLLWDEGEKPCYMSERCIVSPCRKKISCERNSTLSIAAGYSVILTYWKLMDSAADDGFFKALLSRFCAALLKRAYRKAASAHPEFDSQVREHLSALSTLEKNGARSLDKAADKFALILASASAEAPAKDKQRILSQLLYHTGRWIYISDAVNDLSEDSKKGNYNPVALRFSLNDGILSNEAKESLKITLAHSLNNIYSAFQLLPENSWSGVLKNIIYLGMPDVTDRVFNGELEDINRIIPRNKEFRSKI